MLLTPKAFATLLVLTRNAGHVVEKNDLMTEVWPETAVEESTLTQNVFTLRKVLGPTESGEPYIETVPKRGYRLAAAVLEGCDEAPEQAAGPIGSVPGTSTSPLRRYHPFLVAAAGLAAIVASIGVGWFSNAIPFAGGPQAAMTIERLTNTGNASVATVSPDGKFVAYVVSEVGRESLWIRLVATGRAMELVPLVPSRFQGVTFSRDGNWIYYTMGATVFEIPVVGGQSRKLITAADSAITLSPDGRRFAFVRDSPRQGESAVILAATNGAATTTLATRRLPEYFRSVAWAPRGDVLVAAVGTKAGERQMTLNEIAVDTGVERPLGSERWFETRQLAWLSDETGLVLSASARSSNPFQLWRVSYPGGRVTRVTNDLDDYSSPSLTADSTELVSLKRSDVSDLWVASAPFSQFQRISADEGRAERPSWTPDGRIVYESRASGNRDVWIMQADGSNKKQLTFDPASDHSPTASPRSDHVYFVSDRTGVPHIWKMGTDGSNPIQLTLGDGEVTPDCSPDGAWLVYESVGSGRPLLWRISTSGGTPVPLTDTLSRAPAISPDGSQIALYHWNEEGGTSIRLAIIPSTGGLPVKSFEFHGIIPSRFLRWSPDGQSLTYVVTENGISNIWSQPLDGEPARPVTQWGADVITFFDWSHPGGRLAFTRHIRREDIVLISAFR